MGVGEIMAKAVFLDRDGVLNELVYNPATGEYESPLDERDLELCPGVPDALTRLQALGYLLFLVSNQPNYAKGKATLESIKRIDEKFRGLVTARGITFAEYYYCLHHPAGTTPGYGRGCECRKPKPYFPLAAARDYGLEMGRSWFIGDQDSDVLCGQAAGLRTILIENVRSAKKRGESAADYTVRSISEAVARVEEQGA
jgi:D-glycero-D-manno-heptose 1,7-bisphosphate phosphatase